MMEGALADQRTLTTLIEKWLPELSAHFRALEFDVTLVSVQWCLCLFIGKMHQVRRAEARGGGGEEGVREGGGQPSVPERGGAREGGSPARPPSSLYSLPCLA